MTARTGESTRVDFTGSEIMTADLVFAVKSLSRPFENEQC